MDGFSGYNKILMALEDMEKTTFITEWGTYCYRVMPFWLKNVGTTYQRATTTLFHDMMHRNVEVYVDDMIVKSQGHMLSERGIEVDPDKIKVILDMPVPRTKKEIRGFLGRLQLHQLLHSQIDKHIASYVRTSTSSTFINFRRGLGMRLRHYMTEHSVCFTSRLDPLRLVDDDFPNEEFIAMTSLSSWCMYFDDTTNHSWFGIGILLISPKVIIFRETALELNIRQMETRLPRAQNQFADALATLASSVDFLTDVVIRPLLIESRFAPACCCLIGDIEVQDDLPWHHNIYQLLRSGTYPEDA
ncbi:hypothetical protein CK203_057583 [Vitis vinifera]|uniref:Reverse transcriptase domain-containing protein n=1 Tax=Vitis vinifera TaxID=29760 RepID=A0A438GGV6_VITVI|nr:hypothetical protein CK203_057583 [Vitis vinifera]